MTAALVVVNVLVFVAQAFIGEPFTNGFSLVPEEITTFRDLTGTKYLKAKVLTDGHFDGNGQYQPPRLEDKNIPIKHYTGPFPIFLTLLTSMFMHAGWLHIIGNMIYLWAFGPAIEDAMGRGRYLLFY